MHSFKSTCDLLCVYGKDFSSYAEALVWLEEGAQRRLFFVVEGVFSPLPSHPRALIYMVETPLKLPSIAMEIGRQAVFLTIAIENRSNSDLFSSFEKMVQDAHAIADLRLHDFADYGIKPFSNALANLEIPFYKIEGLKDAFTNLPAVLVGSGPSLEKNRHLLPGLQDKALLFAGGSSLRYMPCAPFLGVGIDPHMPISSSFGDIPFFLQARMHPENTSFPSRFLLPDSHFDFLNHCTGTFSRFECGWTVGNAMVALALHLGCNPIVCVGMDFCYQDAAKYIFQDKGEEVPLVWCKDRFGRNVQTQKDWLLSVRWMEEIEKMYPQTSFFNATEGGLPFFSSRPLSSFAWEPILEEKKRWPSLPLQRVDLREKWEDPAIQETLLHSLWEVWEPVFARAQIDHNDLALHRQLFFERVLSEYRSVL